MLIYMTQNQFSRVVLLVVILYNIISYIDNTNLYIYVNKKFNRTFCKINVHIDTYTYIYIFFVSFIRSLHINLIGIAIYCASSV